MTSEARDIVGEKLDAAHRLVIGAIVASCECGIKTPDIFYHDPGCRYVTLTYLLENIEQARQALDPRP